jgi:endonuclease YncB( thermonuclease family)
MGLNNSIHRHNYDNTLEFSLNNLIKEARVVDIYDGDTCTCIFELNRKYHKFVIRLAGIDTPEITSKNEQNKKTALEARKRLCTLISNDFINMDINIKRKELRNLLNAKCYLIKIKCGQFDKYGRLLGWLYSNHHIIIGERTFNQCLIDEKLAYVYNGGTKLTEQEQELL